MKIIRKLADEASNQWCDSNPMAKRDARGNTSWGVYSMGYEAGYYAALEAAAVEASEYLSGPEAAGAIRDLGNQPE